MARNKKMEEDITMDSKKNTNKIVPVTISTSNGVPLTKTTPKKSKVNANSCSISEPETFLEIPEETLEIKKSPVDSPSHKKETSKTKPIKVSTKQNTKILKESTLTEPNNISKPVLPAQKNAGNIVAPANLKVTKSGTSSKQISKTSPPNPDANRPSMIKKTLTSKNAKNLVPEKNTKVRTVSPDKKTRDTIVNNVKRNKAPVKSLDELIRIMEKIEKGIQNNNQLLKSLVHLVSTSSANNKSDNIPITPFIEKVNTNIDSISTGNTIIASNIQEPSIREPRKDSVAPATSNSSTTPINKPITTGQMPPKTKKVSSVKNHTLDATDDMPKTLPAQKNDTQSKDLNSTSKGTHRGSKKFIEEPNSMHVKKGKKNKDAIHHAESNQTLGFEHQGSKSQTNPEKNIIGSPKHLQTNGSVSNKEEKIISSFSFKVFFKRTENENSIIEKTDKVATYIISYLKNRAFVDSINKGIVKSKFPDTLPIQLETYRNVAEDATYFKFNVYSPHINDKTIGKIIENIQDKFFQAEKLGWFKSFVYAL